MGRKPFTIQKALDKYVGVNRMDMACWVWTGPVTRNGHNVVPALYLGGKGLSARRTIREHYLGPTHPSLHVRPMCGNPLCISPWHTFAGLTLKPIEDQPVPPLPEDEAVSLEMGPATIEDLEAVFNMLPPEQRTAEHMQSLGFDASMITQFFDR